MSEQLKQMLVRYKPESFSDYSRAIREVIQEVALLGLWRAKFFEVAAFYGGTALRIFYGLDRFSEDLDFSLLHPDENFSIERYHNPIQDELESFGFSVEVEKKINKTKSPIESAFVKANTYQEFLRIGVPQILYTGLHPETTIKIKLEIDKEPPMGFKTEAKLLNDPIPVSVRTYILSDLFAGKVHALLCRLWKNRIKGRDWYDFVWFVRRGVALNIDHLEQRMQQSGHLSEGDHLTEEKVKKLIREKIATLDVELAKMDISPFIDDLAKISSWSKEFFLLFVDRLGSND